jgi:ribosomal protein S12 methylthiotransferase accessory factor YcaO
MVGNLAQDKQNQATSFENSLPLFTPTVTGEVEIKRPAGYVVPGIVALSVTVEASGFTATGYGEGPRECAREKAISEAFERLALYRFCADHKTKETSSGWAAHYTADLAIWSAILELVERDVALSTWENGGPFLMVPDSLWPVSLVMWKNEARMQPEYSDLQIFLSSNENGACISALLFNQGGNFVVGHASAFRLEDAILSAVNECFRAAHSAIQFRFYAETVALHLAAPGATASPGAHSLAYAYKEAMPDSVRTVTATEHEVISQWERHQIALNDLNLADFDIQIFLVGDRNVARVKSPRYRQIFWGRTNDLSKRNKHPHFVG